MSRRRGSSAFGWIKSFKAHFASRAEELSSKKIVNINEQLGAHLPSRHSSGLLSVGGTRGETELAVDREAPSRCFRGRPL